MGRERYYEISKYISFTKLSYIKQFLQANINNELFKQFMTACKRNRIYETIYATKAIDKEIKDLRKIGNLSNVVFYNDEDILISKDIFISYQNRKIVFHINYKYQPLFKDIIKKLRDNLFIDNIVAEGKLKKYEVPEFSYFLMGCISGYYHHKRRPIYEQKIIDVFNKLKA